jgi:hypothetical protein
MIPQRRASVRRLTALGFVLLSALYSGCQTLETRHSSYYEHDGMWCGTYGIGFEEARAAVLTTFTELKMPIGQQGPHRNGIFIDTRTPENLEARVMIMPLGRHLESTRICVRIGGFGTHRQVCERLLEEIARHQDGVRHLYYVPPPPVSPPPGATPGSAPRTAAPPGQSQSSEPTLPPQPVPVGRE